jgi:hypothetical protein
MASASYGLVSTHPPHFSLARQRSIARFGAASGRLLGGFGNDLMMKDLGLAAEAALGVGAAISLGELTRHLYALNSLAGAAGWTFQASSAWCSEETAAAHAQTAREQRCRRSPGDCRHRAPREPRGLSRPS